MGKTRFVNKVAGNTISKEEADKIYMKAEKSYAASLAILGEMKSLEHGSVLNVLPNVHKSYKLKGAEMKDFPDLKTFIYIS